MNIVRSLHSTMQYLSIVCADLRNLTDPFRMLEFRKGLAKDLHTSIFNCKSMLTFMCCLLTTLVGIGLPRWFAELDQGGP